MEKGLSKGMFVQQEEWLEIENEPVDNTELQGCQNELDEIDNILFIQELKDVFYNKKEEQ